MLVESILLLETNLVVLSCFYLVIALVVIATYLIICGEVLVVGNSMMPTLADGCSVTYIKSRFIPRSWYKKGDVIIFTSSRNLCVNNKEGQEQRVELMIKRIQNIHDGSSFTVVGDNVETSFDSRQIGVIHLDDIIGKVIHLK